MTPIAGHHDVFSANSAQSVLVKLHLGREGSQEGVKTSFSSAVIMGSLGFL